MDMNDLFGKTPRTASKKERERLTEAFRAELEASPDRPPGPAGLSRRMGLGSRRNLNGRLTAFRRELLQEAGFRKNNNTNRWYKP